ncbi:hypothetical protein L7F22_007623 [Adiantum nelumboides]|nr:hypothetical protein [Adiantum nelumboides]
MAQEKEKALARQQEKLRRRQQQVQDQDHNKFSMSHCIRNIFYTGDLQGDDVGSSCTTQASQSDCDGSPLTFNQRTLMAEEKEKALVTQKENFRHCQQQAQIQNHTVSYMSQCNLPGADFKSIEDLQDDKFVSSSSAQASQHGYDGSPLTCDQRTRMAQELTMAFSRRKKTLCQHQQQVQDQNQRKLYMRQCTPPFGDIFYAGDL